MAEAVIAISTFRRHLLLRECLESLSAQPYDVHVAVPADEWGTHHAVAGGPKVTYHKLPQQYVGTGAGAPRWFLGERLQSYSYDHVVWCDDDIQFFEGGVGVTQLVESLERHPQLAQVQINKAQTLAHHYDEIVGKGSVNSAGMCWAQRLVDYYAAGGFDPSMSRKEDVDLGYRVQLFGGDSGRLIKQIAYHKKFRKEGGMYEFEASLPGDNHYQRAKENDRRMCDITMAKYPPRSFSLDEDGIIVMRAATLRHLRRLVAAGKVEVRVDGVLNGELAYLKGLPPEPYLRGRLKWGQSDAS